MAIKLAIVFDDQDVILHCSSQNIRLDAWLPTPCPTSLSRPVADNWIDEDSLPSASHINDQTRHLSENMGK